MEDGRFEESYNQWLCFNENEFELIQGEIIYDEENKPVPIFFAEVSDRYYEISVDGDYPDDQNQTFIRWKNILNGAKETCVYAAHLQTDYIDNKPKEVWIIDRLKTENGEWINEN